MRKLGVLTSGGDAPGMNAAIRAVVKTANYYNVEVIGIEGGYQGLIEGKLHELTSTDIDYIADKGGTFLKTSRCPEFMKESGRLKALNVLKGHGMNDLVVIGGEGSFKGAQKLHELGLHVIGIPATIDNDLSYTDYSIGFDTTLNTILECLGKIKDTDLSHDKTTIVEVMGRYCGDLALYSALAGAGEIISTPERKLNFEEICSKLNGKIKGGKKDNLILITENMYDIQELQKYVEDRLDISIRTSILGFIQRGGHPSAFDRILASKMGMKAVELLLKGYSGRAVGIKENDLINVDIEKVHSKVSSNNDKYSLLDTILA